MQSTDIGLFSWKYGSRKNLLLTPFLELALSTKVRGGESGERGKRREERGEGREELEMRVSQKFAHVFLGTLIV
jgi:hypothetical protein